MDKKNDFVFLVTIATGKKTNNVIYYSLDHHKLVLVALKRGLNAGSIAIVFC